MRISDDARWKVDIQIPSIIAVARNFGIWVRPIMIEIFDIKLYRDVGVTARLRS